MKKVLLSTHSLIEYAGAEINIYSLALQFKKMGYYVEIATFQYDYPIKTLFEKEDISVKNILHESPRYTEYDLIWSQHTPTLQFLIFDLNIAAIRIIYSSLSPFEPLEAPPVYVNCLSLCLANSRETKDMLIKEQVKKELIEVFPNFAPEEFINTSKQYYRQHIEKICIVTNHLSDDLKNAVEELKINNIHVDIYGINHNQTFITPEILLEYDAVISIGKTVQYAMVLGLPIYCYDIHGGPGWINTKNYDLAKYFNFSGRGFEQYHLEPQKIVTDILEGYNDNLKSINKIKVLAKQEFDLNRNISEILIKIEKSPTVNLSLIKDRYKLLERHNHAFLREYEYNNYRKKLVEDNGIYISQLENNITNLKENISNLEQTNSILLDEKNKIMNDLNKLEEELKNSNVQVKSLMREMEVLTEKYNHIEKEYIEFTNSTKVELDQKEKNNIYLLELIEEKNQLIYKITNSRAWRLAEKYRINKNRVKKVIKDPKLIIKKIRKQGKDFGKAVIVDKNQDNLIEQNQPLVSVVIPIYDRTDVLITSIESILNQTYKNLELILVCDGSPRETIEIVKSYEQDPRVRTFYFLNNSGNAVRGRNKAIKEARGEYLAFQDSDDIAESNRIELSIQYMKEYDADVIYGGWRAIVDGSRKIDLENNQEIFSPDCDYELLKKICVPCQSTVMAKTSALRKVGGLKPEMKYREDHELWLRLAYANFKFKSIPHVLTNLRLHENNLELTFKDNDKHWEELAMEQHKIIRDMKPKIAYVVAGCGISGGLAVVCQHANGLIERGYDVLIITEDNCESIDWFPNLLAPVISIKEVPQNLDIVVATYWTTAYTIDNIPAKKKYYFVQSDESKFFEKDSREAKAARETYQKSHSIITMATWLQNWLEKEFQRDSFYVPNGVDLKVMYNTSPLVKKNNKLRVLLEGPIDVPFKGMEEAFKVVEDLDCEVWCISTAGKPDPKWKCDKFFENVPMANMKQIYSSCDVLLKMSKVESFCLPALEMMACGGTCVINRFTGIDEFVVDNYNALVVDLGDIEGAKNAIQSLIDDTELRERLKKNALETAQKWSWERTIDNLEKIYYMH